MLIEFYIIPLYKIPKEALLGSLFSLSWCFIRQAVLNLVFLLLKLNCIKRNSLWKINYNL